MTHLKSSTDVPQAGSHRSCHAAAPRATAMQCTVELVFTAVRHQELIIPHGKILLWLLARESVVTVW